MPNKTHPAYTVNLAADLRRSLVEMAIEKDEKTALARLKKQAIKSRVII